MKRFIMVLLVLILVGIFGTRQVQAQLSCSGGAHCLKWNVDFETGFGTCGPGNGLLLPCEDLGGSCGFLPDSSDDCRFCPPHGYSCSTPTESSPAPSSSGSSYSGCGAAAAPACLGACSGGMVCRSVSGSCACRTANSCDDYLGTISDPTVTRLTSTSANVVWQDMSNNQYVDRQHLSVCLYTGGGCVIDEDIPLGTNQKIVLGLSEERYYRARVIVYAGNAPGAFALCSTNGSSNHLASCRLTPNPAQIDVGSNLSLSTNVANDTTYSVTYGTSPGGVASLSPSSDVLYPHLTTATGVTEGTTTANNNVRVWDGGWGAWISICSDTATVNVGNVPPPSSEVSWWQAQGGGVYVGSQAGGVTVASQLPSSAARLILPGVGGTTGALIRASGSADLGVGEVSDALWSTLARYRGKQMDYSYFSAQLGVTRNQASDFGSDTLDLPSYDASKNFWYSAPLSGTATIGTPWTLGVGEKYVVMVEGDLRIEENISVPVGGYLAFIVSGNITVDPTVSQIQGVYIASGDFVTESQYLAGVSDDVPLVVEGNVVAWGSVVLTRDLGASNSTTPGEKFVYRSDLLTNMTTKMKTFVIEWKEVVPGSFGQ